MSEEVEIKAEEKFSATEEFANKISIAFFNEEPTQATTSNDDNSTINTNIQRNKSDNRRYKCDICNKSFNQSIDLVRHKRIHTGERPFECDICKRKFTHLCSLKKHKTIHNREAP